MENCRGATIMFNNNVGIVGEYKIKKLQGDVVLYESTTIPNLITDAGLLQMCANSALKPDVMAYCILSGDSSLPLENNSAIIDIKKISNKVTGDKSNVSKKVDSTNKIMSITETRDYVFDTDVAYSFSKIHLTSDVVEPMSAFTSSLVMSDFGLPKEITVGIGERIQIEYKISFIYSTEESLSQLVIETRDGDKSYNVLTSIYGVNEVGFTYGIYGWDYIIPSKLHENFKMVSLKTLKNKPKDIYEVGTHISERIYTGLSYSKSYAPETKTITQSILLSRELFNDVDTIKNLVIQTPFGIFKYNILNVLDGKGIEKSNYYEIKFVTSLSLIRG